MDFIILLIFFIFVVFLLFDATNISVEDIKEDPLYKFFKRRMK